jgi:hypothetical protein
MVLRVGSLNRWNGKSVKDGCTIAMTIDTFNWRPDWSVTGKSMLDTFTASTYIL